jgi:hypothetical protein
VTWLVSRLCRLIKKKSDGLGITHCHIGETPLLQGVENTYPIIMISDTSVID